MERLDIYFNDYSGNPWSHLDLPKSTITFKYTDGSGDKWQWLIPTHGNGPTTYGSP